MDRMQIYNHLPICIQNLACYVEGKKIKRKRYCSLFWEKLAEYESRNKWSYEQKCDYRDKQLNKMIRYCYNNVPYYHNLFNNLGIDPASVRGIHDLAALPILTKDQVKNNIDKIISTSVDPSMIIVCPTGGTTGAGLRFCTSQDEMNEQWAVWWRYRRRHGIDINTHCGNFGGKQIVPLSQKKPPFWRFNKPCHQVYFSSYHITDNNAEDYADFIRSSNIQWLHGYASSLSELAAYINGKGLQVPLKWVTVGSENMYEHQRKNIERAFCTTPFMHYGLTEGVANISENETGVLTVDEDFACVEFLPTGIPNEYRIIGTALTKHVMPLIRYDTGDIAVIEEFGSHNSDGRIINKISGRSVEYVTLPSGGKVGAASISLAIHDYHFISEMQIIQEQLDRITVCIVRNKKADDFNEEMLMHSLEERFGKDMKIELSYVEETIKSKNGKHRLVISKYNENQ